MISTSLPRELRWSSIRVSYRLFAADGCLKSSNAIATGGFGQRWPQPDAFSAWSATHAEQPLAGCGGLVVSVSFAEVLEFYARAR